MSDLSTADRLFFDTLDRAKVELAKGTGILKTARIIGVGVGTVQKLKREMLPLAQDPSSVPLAS